ncbi:MAG: hypothetical protein EA398_11580 [Deltaproteobacteria bacterium]|nr:MAG: hypothetical protein EA398_11580 [Deltaproteobacteria bacterium]
MFPKVEPRMHLVGQRVGQDHPTIVRRTLPRSRSIRRGLPPTRCVRRTLPRVRARGRALLLAPPEARTKRHHRDHREHLR